MHEEADRVQAELAAAEQEWHRDQNSRGGSRLRIADDFAPPKDSDQDDGTGRPVPAPIDDGEARLAYVAVTRTRRWLDIGGLSWIHDHPDGSPEAPTRIEPRAQPARADAAK